MWTLLAQEAILWIEPISFEHCRTRILLEPRASAQNNFRVCKQHHLDQSVFLKYWKWGIWQPVEGDYLWKLYPRAPSVSEFRLSKHFWCHQLSRSCLLARTQAFSNRSLELLKNHHVLDTYREASADTAKQSQSRLDTLQDWTASFSHRRMPTTLVGQRHRTLLQIHSNWEASLSRWCPTRRMFCINQAIGCRDSTPLDCASW